MEENSEAKELVSTFSATGENYEKAVQALRDRYGDEGMLLQVYIRELLKLVISNATNARHITLSKMYLQLESHLQALSSLQLKNADPSS